MIASEQSSIIIAPYLLRAGAGRSDLSIEVVE